MLKDTLSRKFGEALRYIALPKPAEDGFTEVDYIDGDGRRKHLQSTAIARFGNGQPVWQIFKETLEQVFMDEPEGEEMLTRTEDNLREDEARRIVRERNAALGIPAEADDKHEWQGPVRRVVLRPGR